MIFSVGASMAMAQLPTASILGVVKDTSAAVVPGATLTARNVETGQSRTTVTAVDGSYRFSALPVGNYEVRLEQSGFRAEVRSGLALTVGQEAVVNFTLQVGTIEQTVAVTAEAPLVDTTKGSLGGLVNEERVSDLPLNGRNFINLALLQTGVTQHTTGTKTSNSIRGLLYSSNGAPIRSNNLLLDGAIMQSYSAVSSASVSDSTLGIEGIREYKVITNSFGAEYGLTMGSQTTIVSKGGTNHIHGSAFEFLRNNVLDARNFFDRKTAVTPNRLPPFKRNNFGGSFGGPIKKDQTFFFGVYEGLRERLGVTTISNIIPLAARVDGGLVPEIAPVVKPLLALYPVPNLGDDQLTFPFSRPTREDYGQMRVDHTFSTSDSAFGRYTIDDGEQISPLDFPQFRKTGTSRAQYATLSENHVFSPTLLNTARFSYSRTNIFFDSPTDIIGPQFSFVPGRPIGQITLGGLSTFGPLSTNPSASKQNIFTWSDDAFYTRGRHSLKFGALINRYQLFGTQSNNVRGTLAFANTRSFLLAQPSSVSAVTPGSNVDRTYHFSTVGFYAQDDYRVKPRLTLNLGLRYEFHTTYEEAQGLGAALRDLRKDPQTTLGKPFDNPSLHNFSPRFGFAWDVQGDGKTALRGGFGLLYDVANLGSALVVGNTATPPFSRLSSVQAPPILTLPLVFPPEAAGNALRPVDFNLEQTHLLQYNLTVERQLPFDMALTLSYAGSRGINILRTKEGNPTVPQILPDGRKFFTGREPRLNPNFGTIELKTADGNSWYNSLQIGLLKRLSKGLQFQSSYTFAKSLDEGQGQLVAENTAISTFGTDPLARSVDKGPAAFDLRHNWRFNAIYRLPEPLSSGGAAAKLLNGWWLSGILSLSTGYPFTPGLGANRSRSQVNAGGANIDRPDLAPGRSNDNIILGGPDRYFDPTAFRIPQAGFLGTAGSAILRGTGLANLDFTLAKDTKLGFVGESGKLEFRAEFFNILNRANFDVPSRTVFAARSDTEAPLATAGRITSTIGTSRQIQFALKFLF